MNFAFLSANRPLHILVATVFFLLLGAIYGETPSEKLNGGAGAGAAPALEMPVSSAQAGSEEALYQGLIRVCREAPELFLPVLLETFELFPVLASDEHRTIQKITHPDPLLAQEIPLLGRSLSGASIDQLASSAYRIIEILHSTGRHEQFRKAVLSDAARAFPDPSRLARMARESWHGFAARRAYFLGVIGSNLYPENALFWNIRCSFLFREFYHRGSYPAWFKFRWAMAQALRLHPDDASLWFTRARWNWWQAPSDSMEDLRQAFRLNPQDHLVPFWLAQKEQEFGVPASYPELILNGAANDDRALKNWLERIEP
ncbi:MAG: hypothetical protein AB1403_20475 [Candidatus Riflebacteria bacterium]